MDYKSLLTDNIYKFFLLMGFVLVFYNSYFLSEQLFDINMDVVKSESEINKLLIEREWGLKIIDEYHEQSNQLRSYLEENIKIYGQFIKKLDSTEVTKKDWIEFDKQVTDLDSIINILSDKTNILNTSASEFMFKQELLTEEIKLKTKIIELKLNRYDIYNSTYIIGLFLGAFFIYFGLYKWGKLQLMTERIFYIELGEKPPESLLFNSIYRWFKKKI